LGIGDNVIATSFAKGARDRGKRIAFGDGTRLLWDQHSEQVFRNNPNLVHRGESVLSDDVEWVHFFKGKRGYNHQAPGRWIWNESFKVQPGEFFFTDSERAIPRRLGLPRKFIVVEPSSIKLQRDRYFLNKQWPTDRYDQLVNALRSHGHKVVQFIYDDRGYRLPGAQLVQTPTYRQAATILAEASLYIGSEGGLHHAAAAVGIPAVVMFGGWLPPAVLGYDFHTNLTGGATEFCGLFQPCEHCARAMAAISVEEAFEAAKAHLSA
jgi:ADP-heptose:LPS heptosyltransferase